MPRYGMAWHGTGRHLEAAREAALTSRTTSELDSVKGWRLQLVSGASGAGLMYLGRHAWRPKGEVTGPKALGG